MTRGEAWDDRGGGSALGLRSLRQAQDDRGEALPWD
jgi:hypothetical protein